MNKQIIGWIIISLCLLWGALRSLEFVDPNFVISFFAIGGFCFGVYLTKDPNDDEK
ncbi:MAG: hypothetical protein ACO3NN_06110 [Candidatus Puniceispirillales bacterium]|jgi:hypothetical protein|nr:hypothetical protein [Alphaproteobacteria bacterium]